MVINRFFEMDWHGSSHRRCSVKKGVLKNSGNFTGKHLRWSLFLILQAFRPKTLLKRDSNTNVSLWNLRNFSEYLFWRASANDCFYISTMNNVNGWYKCIVSFSLSQVSLNYILFTNHDFQQRISNTSDSYILRTFKTINSKWYINTKLIVNDFDWATIIFIIFWDFLMFYQISPLPQAKLWAIFTYKHGIYELPHKLPDDVRLNFLGN